MWIAEAAGFSQDESFEIAKYDQAIDDDPATKPLPDLTSLGYGRRKAFHFVDAARIAELKKQAQGCKLRDIGGYLHALEDLRSHRNYGPLLGHASAGTTPDKPWTDPGAFVEMVSSKLSELGGLKSKCSKNSGALISKLDVDSAKAAVKEWAAEEYAAGVGHPGSPERWNKLLPLVFKAREGHYRSMQEKYETWVTERKQAGWK